MGPGAGNRKVISASPDNDCTAPAMPAKLTLTAALYGPRWSEKPGASVGYGPDLHRTLGYPTRRLQADSTCQELGSGEQPEETTGSCDRRRNRPEPQRRWSRQVQHGIVQSRSVTWLQQPPVPNCPLIGPGSRRLDRLGEGKHGGWSSRRALPTIQAAPAKGSDENERCRPGESRAWMRVDREVQPS